jgi:hypothetical protein
MDNIVANIQSFRENGFVVFPSALNVDLIDSFWDDVEFQIEHNINLTVAELRSVRKSPLRREI